MAEIIIYDQPCTSINTA